MKDKTIKVLLLSMFMGSLTQAAEFSGESSKYELSIINKEMIAFFASKPQVRVEVAVEDACGNGDRALDFFLVETNGDAQNIPTSLATILPRSDFLKLAIDTLFKSGSKVLKISEALSEPSGRGSINGFIGITPKDLPESR